MKTRSALQNLAPLGLVLLVTAAFTPMAGAADATGDYRSQITGSFNTAGNWQRFNGTTWVTATAVPQTSDGVITIRSGYTMNTTSSRAVDQVVVEAGGVLSIGSTLTFNDGAGVGGDGVDLRVSGAVVNTGGNNTFVVSASGKAIFESGAVYTNSSSGSGTLNMGAGSNIQFKNGSAFYGNKDGGAVPPGAFTTWDAGSKCEIIGWLVSGSTPGGMSGSTFADFIWNSPAQTGNVGLGGALAAVNGTLNVKHTGTGSIRLNANSPATLTVTYGNLTVSGGSLNLVSGTAAVTVNVATNLSITSGTLDMGSGSVSSVLNVTNDVSITGGTLSKSGALASTINFARSGAQALTVTVPVALTPVWNVNSGSTVTLDSSSAFTNGTLSVAGAFINNGILSVNTNLSGAGTLTQGANSTLNIGGTSAIGTLDATSNTPNTVNYSKGGSQTLLGFNYHHLTLSGANTKTLAANTTVNGTLAVSNGVSLDFNSQTVSIASAPTLAGTLIMEVTKTAPNTFTGSKLTQTAGTLTYGGALTFTNLGLTLQSGESIDLFDGSLAGSFSPLNLPGGLGHWNTNDLNVGGTITFTNNNPAAGNFSLGVAVGGSVSVNAIGKYAAATDADGDAVTISAVSTPANGTATIMGGTNLLYTSTNSAASDSFTYTVSDGVGGTDTKTVTVSTYSPEGFNRLSPPSVIGPGTVTLSYLGIPGYNYALDWATNLTPPINWMAVITNPAAGDGSLSYTNTSTEPANFFRTRYVP